MCAMMEKLRILTDMLVLFLDSERGCPRSGLALFTRVPSNAQVTGIGAECRELDGRTLVDIFERPAAKLLRDPVQESLADW